MSGSAKAGTIAERHTCELRVLPQSAVRAPPKRASGGILDVGKPEIEKARPGPQERLSEN